MIALFANPEKIFSEPTSNVHGYRRDVKPILVSIIRRDL